MNTPETYLNYQNSQQKNNRRHKKESNKNFKLESTIIEILKNH